MKQISNKEYEKYQQYLTDQLHGRTLTPDGLFRSPPPPGASFPLPIILSIWTKTRCFRG